MAKFFGKTLRATLLLVCALLIVAESSSQSRSQVQIRKLGMKVNKGPFEHTHVYIHNNLGPGLQAKVIAWSPFKKFGTKILENGETDEFGFTPLFLPQFTDVQSNISWAKGHMEMANIFWWSRDHFRCGKFCHWNITTEGVYGLDRNLQPELHYFWKKI